MRYIQIKIHASRQGIEAVAPILLPYGVTGYSVDDPADFEDILGNDNPYEWDYIDGQLVDGSLGQETLDKAAAGSARSEEHTSELQSR